VTDDLRKTMQDNVGIVRDQQGLERALADIEKLRRRAAGVGISGSREYNPGWHTCLDLRGQIVVAEMVARSCLERKESRGAHTRLDFPDSVAALERVEVVVKKDGDRMTVRQNRQPEIPADLKALIKEGVKEGTA
jgi:succinate dehydrogenase / fumarate reductase flavoprotein subunit